MEKISLKVSIAVPVYGVEKYIERCARSLFEQTYKDIEFVFVNDCTPDNSIRILENVIKDYPQRKDNVKIVHNETNKGLAVTRFVGINNCTSEFLYNIDSDDYLERNTIDLLVSKQYETNADIVSSHMYINEQQKNKNFIHPDYNSPKDMLMDILSQLYHHELCGRLIRRNLFLHSDIYPVEGHNFGEDWIVTPKLVYYARKIALVDEFLYHYYKENTYSYTSSVNKIRGIEQNIKSLFLLLSFFQNHSCNQYVTMLSNYISNLLQIGLFQGLENNDRISYNIILNYCCKIDSSYTSRIWGHGIKKEIMQHYYLANMMYSISKYIRHYH